MLAGVRLTRYAQWRLPLAAAVVSVGMATAEPAASAPAEETAGVSKSFEWSPTQRGAVPLVLPAASAASRERMRLTRWIVGARPGRASAVLARRHGGRPIGGDAYVVDVHDARGFADDLRRIG